MLFGAKLRNDRFPPWKDFYMDYDTLKDLLDENGIQQDWHDKQESSFVEFLDKQLEKVYSFQKSKYNSLMDKLAQLEKQTDSEEKIKNLNSNVFQTVLENCLTEAKELDNFSRSNFTGFIKIVKKHDKLHPNYPSVRSLLEVRLKELPFHSEELSPLLYKISLLYNILRGNFNNNVSTSLASTSKLSRGNNDDEFEFKTFKFWIHPDNLMEVKTRILRHLPVLVYASAPTESVVEDFDDNEIVSNSTDSLHSSLNSSMDDTNNLKKNYSPKSLDPNITALYFDNEFFELYNNKLLKNIEAPTLRLRWIGKLNDNPDIFIEKRTMIEDSNGRKDFEVTKFKIKSKYLNGFIFNGDTQYKETILKKLKGSGTVEMELNKLSNDFDDIQQLILQNDLQPLLRTIYRRTAFQIPGDDRVRITVDSDILYIREDSFDKKRPIRKPSEWHRSDIDADVTNPLKFLRKGEYAKFPFSVMEIKVKNNDVISNFSEPTTMSKINLPNRHGKWISELTNSHLVKEVPNFSLYIQGVASLFGDEEKLDILPFWLPDIENDIKRDPTQAYEEEQQKIKKQKEFQAKIDGMRRLSKIQKDENVIEPFNFNSQNTTVDLNTIASNKSFSNGDLEDHESSDEETTTVANGQNKKKKKSEPTFLNILAGRNSKLDGFDSEDEEIDLPVGVNKPTSYLKNAGPIKVEAKVWLANERTFNRWLHVTSLLSILTFSIYNSVKKAAFPNLANYLAYIYFSLTIFSGSWAYYTYIKRLNVIKERSGQHLDAPLGPIVLAFVLAVTLIINFVVAFRDMSLERKQSIASLTIEPVFRSVPTELQWIENLIFKLVGAA